MNHHRDNHPWSSNNNQIKKGLIFNQPWETQPEGKRQIFSFISAFKTQVGSSFKKNKKCINLRKLFWNNIIFKLRSYNVLLKNARFLTSIKQILNHPRRKLVREAEAHTKGDGKKRSCRRRNRSNLLHRQRWKTRLRLRLRLLVGFPCPAPTAGASTRALVKRPWCGPWDEGKVAPTFTPERAEDEALALATAKARGRRRRRWGPKAEAGLEGTGDDGGNLHWWLTLSRKSGLIGFKCVLISLRFVPTCDCWC